MRTQPGRFERDFVVAHIDGELLTTKRTKDMNRSVRFPWTSRSPLLAAVVTTVLGSVLSFPHASSGNPGGIQTGPPIKAFGGDGFWAHPTQRHFQKENECVKTRIFFLKTLCNSCPSWWKAS